ncbi:MAG: radical SAM protein [Anaerolineales bacterium]
MIIEQSSKFMRRSFERTTYTFRETPAASLEGTFGIYVHVPFCLSKCTFCPFYKELLSKELKGQYVEALLREIAETRMEGRAKWIYVGGGTPNVLTLEELGAILGAIRRRVEVGSSVGTELLPALVNRAYLQGLAELGFTKVSIGVESLADEVILPTGRRAAREERIDEIVREARELDLWVNVDLMVGLPEQSAATFLEDVRRVAEMEPSQVTLYPFMIIRGLQAEPGVPTETQFELIERAAESLVRRGYERQGIWTFAQGEDVYDSSRDELVEDYVGFGPAAFSTYAGWKVVNPELAVYLRSVSHGHRLGFVAPKSAETDAWRTFARRIYDLRGDGFGGLPLPIRLFAGILRLTGYVRGGGLTEKGILLSHTLSKSVVESLPFPVQNPGCVENYEEYAAYREEAKGLYAVG